ncbi:TPA: hypothetical protein ACU0X0_002847 [Legionella anisa]
MLNLAKTKFKDLLFSLYIKVSIFFIKKTIFYEGKIKRRLKDSLSYKIRIFYNKSMIGENPLVDELINITANEILDIPNSPNSITQFNRAEIEEITSTISSDKEINVIKSLNFQLSAVKNFYLSNLILSKDESYKHDMHSDIAKAVEFGELIIDKDKPDFKQLSLKSNQIYSATLKDFINKNQNRNFQHLSYAFFNISKFLTILVLAVLALSSTYEYGYFSYFEISINFIPFTYQDIILASFQWVIIIGLGSLSALLFYLIYNRMTYGFSLKEIEKISPTKAYTKDGFIFTLYTFLAFIPLVTIIPDKNYQNYTILICVSYLWTKLIIYLFNHPRILIKRPFYIKYLITYTPLFLLLFFICGHNQANFDLKNAKFDSCINCSENKKITNISILKTLSKGIIYYDKNKTINFIPYEQIKSLKFA